jgi:hypothetical protein
LQEFAGLTQAQVASLTEQQVIFSRPRPDEKAP